MSIYRKRDREQAPRVTVILTSFNHAKYLQESIDSVLSQTFADFELLILDDASTDESWYLIHRYRDRRIKAIRSKRPREIVHQINAAISNIARGELIAIHHSDDVWEPSKLERQVELLDMDDTVGAVFTNATAIDENGLPIADGSHFYSSIFNQPNRTRHDWLRFFIENGNALCHPSMLARSSCLKDCGPYSSLFLQLCDFDMWVRLCLRYEIRVLQEPLVRFRVRAGEANASGNRLETRTRWPYEFYKILSNYRHISSIDDLIKIFPSAKTYYRGRKTNIDFALAMAMLDTAKYSFTKLYALDILFEILSDRGRAAELVRLYDFDTNAFFALTGRHDVFSGESLAQRDAQITTLKQLTNEQERQMAEQRDEIVRRDAQITALNELTNEQEQRIAEQRDKTIMRDVQISALKEIVNEQERRMAEQRDEIEKREVKYRGEISIFREEAIKNRDQSQRERVEFDKWKQNYLSQISTLTEEMAQGQGETANLTFFLSESRQQLADMTRRLDWAMYVGDESVRHFQLQLEAILNSRSWRMMGFLRTVITNIKRVVRLVRKDTSSKSTILRYVSGGVDINTAILQLEASPLFDGDYYLTRNLDVREAGMNPAEHYLLYGWRELRNPSEVFSTSQYLSVNPDVAHADINPLLHYLQYGWREGRRLLESVAPARIVSNDSISPGSNDSSEPNDIESNVLPETIEKEIDVIRDSGLFDESFYCLMYPELGLAQGLAIRHYCEHGWREGKNPTDDFDTNFYLATYDDIRVAGINPFWHYIIAGSSELRHPLPNLSRRYEDDIWFGPIVSDIMPIAFYGMPNWNDLRKWRSIFKGHLRQGVPIRELGFYVAGEVSVLERQITLAKKHGIYAFCFDVPCSAKDALLIQPVEVFLDNNQIDFKFCISVDLSHEEYLYQFTDIFARSVEDSRYISIQNRPLLVVDDSRGKQFDIDRVILKFRKSIINRDVEDPVIIRRSFYDCQEQPISTDGMEFGGKLNVSLTESNAGITGVSVTVKNGVSVVPYSLIASGGIKRIQVMRSSGGDIIFPCITLGRDDTICANSERPIVFSRFTLNEYRRWLDAAIQMIRDTLAEDRRYLFIDAWNSWSEGLFLEPEQQEGYSRLNETTRALLGIPVATSMPKISIVVPNFNHGRFLRRRLDSIYQQTYRNVEILLLDDFSTDDSRTILDEYAKNHPEITHRLYNESNSGSPFRQWAKGLEAATGDLIWIAESDDYCDLNFLEVLVRCFDDEAVLLAYAKSKFVDENDQVQTHRMEDYLDDLDCAAKWGDSYVETAHNEVRDALGIKNTIPNASAVLFRRPIEMSLLKDNAWLSMSVAGDWVFYLHIIRGGRIAYSTRCTNYFRRYQGSTAETTYKKENYYREIAAASRVVSKLYDVPQSVLMKCRKACKDTYDAQVGREEEEFERWYGDAAEAGAVTHRLPNVMIATMGFFPGGAEILPIRLANEFKRQGLSVLLLNAGLNPREEGIRRMLRSDVPVIEASSVKRTKEIILEFGIELFNTHQWHIQKYPLQISDVFRDLRGHVASLHGMIEHGEAFAVTEGQLRVADENVSTWVYTAEKNLIPFEDHGLLDRASGRFVKIPNGMPPTIVNPIDRAELGIPQDAFVLCCVSRAIPDKGWADAIEAVKRARMLSDRDIRLILVGNGPVYDRYCGIGVPEFVHLIGFSENSVGYYAAADMGIMLTKFKSESFPLTIVDCLFAGRPYIASDVGDIRGMLTTDQGVAGEVIELQDWQVPVDTAAEVIAKFAMDRESYEQVRAEVHDAAIRYRIDVVASQYIELFIHDCR